MHIVDCIITTVKCIKCGDETIRKAKDKLCVKCYLDKHTHIHKEEKK